MKFFSNLVFANKTTIIEQSVVNCDQISDINNIACAKIAKERVIEYCVNLNTKS